MSEPIELTVTLNLDNHLRGETSYDYETGEPTDHGAQTVEDIVIHAAAVQLAERATRSPYGDALRQKVQTIRDELIVEAITPLIREAIDAAVQPTNTFGEASCAPTTLRTIIVGMAEAWLRAPANDRGGRRVGTNLDVAIAEQVGQAFVKEIAGAVADAKAEAVAVVREQAGLVVAETIARAAKASS